MSMDLSYKRGKLWQQNPSQNDDADRLREPDALDDVLAARRLEEQRALHERRARHGAAI